MITESYSLSSDDETPPKDGSASQSTVASSKPTLSDIYERSEEGESEKNRTTLSGKNRTTLSGKNRTTLSGIEKQC